MHGVVPGRRLLCYKMSLEKNSLALEAEVLFSCVCQDSLMLLLLMARFRRCNDVALAMKQCKRLIEIRCYLMY